MKNYISFKTERARAEQAEVQRAAMKCCGNCMWYKNCKKYDNTSGSDYCEKWKFIKECMK